MRPLKTCQWVATLFGLAACVCPSHWPTLSLGWVSPTCPVLGCIAIAQGALGLRASIVCSLWHVMVWRMLLAGHVARLHALPTLLLMGTCLKALDLSRQLYLLLPGRDLRTWHCGMPLQSRMAPLPYLQ